MEMYFIECSSPTTTLLVWNIELVCLRRSSVTQGARMVCPQVFRGTSRGFLTRCSLRFQVGSSWSPGPCLFLVNYSVSQKVDEIVWRDVVVSCWGNWSHPNQQIICMQLFGVRASHFFSCPCNVKCKVSGSDFSAIKIWLSDRYRRPSTSGEGPEMRAVLQFIRILLTTVRQVCKKNL